MSKKAPRRAPVPVYCTQPAPKRRTSDSEDMDDLWNFSPIRVAETSSPKTPGRTKCSDPLNEDKGLRKEKKRVVSDADMGETKTPPLNAQPRHCAGSSITHENFLSNGNKRRNVFADLDQEDQPPKRIRSEAASALEAIAVSIKASLDRMILEAREDRQELNDTLKALIKEENYLVVQAGDADMTEIAKIVESASGAHFSLESSAPRFPSAQVVVLDSALPAAISSSDSDSHVLKTASVCAIALSATVPHTNMFYTALALRHNHSVLNLPARRRDTGCLIEDSQMTQFIEFKRLPEPPASPLSNTLPSTTSLPHEELLFQPAPKAGKLPRANRLSILYHSRNRRLVMDAEILESLKVFHKEGRIEIVVNVHKEKDVTLKGILVEALSEVTKFNPLPPTSNTPLESDASVHPSCNLTPLTTILLAVYLDTAGPLPEPTWVKTGDIQDWLKGMFGRMFWVSRNGERDLVQRASYFRAFYSVLL
ncbi:hypothetical protein HYPSUDRAFT_209668 [Hypholoma sublateritium FD-334 SS-4]|uniref:Uncharacterized protein n=1 Tax=Hypholoma sublateritium (strain FD-334 SS-4) TaxID=945553 RepID=A0A0D2KFT9_HYPSF|nr:hypothetical protein HYPSUDRAFT_209668 [Hypholoma sublateritium FD-334 SS-4]